MRRWVVGGLLGFLALFVLPLGLRAGYYYLTEGQQTGWSRDQSSSGLLPPAASPEASVHIFAARTVRWRGIFAVHSWIVVKPAGAGRYTRYDKVGWGSPIRVNGYPPDGRWFGHDPELVFAATGADAERLIPLIEAAVAAYPYADYGDYRLWPGPNSNSFVAAVLAAVPEIGASLPPLAIGKDYPVDGRWLGWSPSRTGVRISLAGYAGLTLAWVEGIELNLLGAVLGVDIRRPALKLPGLGRIGLSPTG